MPHVTSAILLFPGQGSQQPGMAKDLVDAYPAARAVFDEADRVLGVSLSTLCFEGPEHELTSTQNAQPALLAHGAAVWAVVRDRLAGGVRAAAGHSLGEFTAHHAAGSLSLTDSLRIVRRRGELMYASGVESPGAMAAILGLDAAAVEDACRRAAAECGAAVVPANYNSDDQLVISGAIGAVERAMALAKAAGANRAIRLNVSGAFHSPLMAKASGGLRSALDAATFAEPAFAVYSNVNARATTDAASAKRLLLDQLISPVRWSGSVRNLVADYPGAFFVEMGPARVLTNLVKRVAPGAETATCGTVADVEQLLSRLS